MFSEFSNIASRAGPMAVHRLETFSDATHFCGKFPLKVSPP